MRNAYKIALKSPTWITIIFLCATPNIWKILNKILIFLISFMLA